MTVRSVSAYETGRAKPRGVTLHKLAAGDYYLKVVKVNADKSTTVLVDRGIDNNEKIQLALDKIKDKYGSNIINPASLLENDD